MTQRLLIIMISFFHCGPVLLAEPEPNNVLETSKFFSIIESHNARTAELGDVWSRADVELSWVDPDGTKKFESGEGHLIFRPPNNLALSFGKLGETYGWVGTNAEFAWFYTRAESEVEVIRTSNAYLPCADPLPSGIFPLEFMQATALAALPVTASDFSGKGPLGLWIGHIKDEWLIWRQGSPFSYRYYFRDGEATPYKTEVIQPQTFKPIVTTLLSDYQEVKTKSGNLLLIPGQIVAEFPEVSGKLTIRAKDISDRAPLAERINESIFDFHALVESWGDVEIKVLDKNCPEPAVSRTR